MLSHWFMIFGGLLILVFCGGIIVLIVWGVKKVIEDRGSGSGTSKKPAQLDIAKERYAKGEISREDFEQIKRDLS